MPRRPKTAFDRYFAEKMKEPGFAAGYRAARAEIGATDHLIRALEAARVSVGLTKAELARKVGLRSKMVQRLLTSGGGDPSLETVMKVASALGNYLELVPDRGAEIRRAAERRGSAAPKQRRRRQATARRTVR